MLPGRDPLVLDFEDLSHGHREVADGGPSDTTVPDVSGCNIIRKGILFATMDHLKSWLQSTPLCKTIHIGLSVFRTGGSSTNQ